MYLNLIRASICEILVSFIYLFWFFFFFFKGFFGMEGIYLKFIYHVIGKGVGYIIFQE